MVVISKAAVDRLSRKLAALKGTGRPVDMAEELRMLTLQVIGEAILSLPPEECDKASSTFLVSRPAGWGITELDACPRWQGTGTTNSEKAASQCKPCNQVVALVQACIIVNLHLGKILFCQHFQSHGAATVRIAGEGQARTPARARA